MNQKQKHLVFVLAPLAITMFLTTIGVITGSVVPISIAALIWLVPLFIAFAFTDRLWFWLKAVREGRLSYRHFAADPRLSEDIKKEIVAAWDIPIAFAGVLRALTFAAASMVIDLFSTLQEGDLSAIPKQIQTTLVLAAGSLTMTFIDLARGKSIKKPGFFMRAVAVVGAVSFFRGFLLIMSGLGGLREYRPMRALLSSPVWFVSEQNVELVRSWIVGSDLAMGIILRLVFPFIFFLVGLDMLRAPLTEDNVDSKNFAAALAIMSFWIASQWLAFVSY